MKTNVEKMPKSTIKLTVTVPTDKVKESYDKVLTEAVKATELPGFRKGMAPREMVAEKSDVSKLYGEVINDLLQTYYPQALKENHIVPVSNPKVEIKEFNLEKEFEFTALVATRPEVKVGEFKKKLKAAQENKEKTTKEENAKKLAAGEEIKDSHDHLETNDIIDILLEVSVVDVPELLVEEETERMMARLLDQAQSIGISLEQYLKAQNKTSEQLKEEYTKIAERSLKAEFV
jgi:trigger factor